MPTLPEIAAAMRDHALALPGATEDFPWGERVVKVNKKVFVFLGKAEEEGGSFGFSVKLPESGEAALELPYASPTGYGLGKSGWVSFSFAPRDQPDLAPLLAYLEESWRAVAPKKLVKARAAG
ncbi:MAG: MmcQ/YjbR family DNA-binding protein [Myxococcota bacterium]